MPKTNHYKEKMPMIYQLNEIMKKPNKHTLEMKTFKDDLKIDNKNMRFQMQIFNT